MCFLKDRGMPCFGRGRKKRSMHQHAVSCWSYKKECCSFLLIQLRKSAAIFSRAYAVHGAWKWCKHFVRFVLERRGEEKRETKEDTTEDVQHEHKVNNPTDQMCVCLYWPLSLRVSVRGPLNSRLFCNPTVQESGEKTPKIPSAINLSLPPLCLSRWVR